MSLGNPVWLDVSLGGSTCPVDNISHRREPFVSSSTQPTSTKTFELSESCQGNVTGLQIGRYDPAFSTFQHRALGNLSGAEWRRPMQCSRRRQSSYKLEMSL